MISACQSRYLQVGYDILSRPVLVADIGSSTTDFAYISHGREVEMQTAGEVALGGGLMDEKLLDMAVRSSKEEKIIREVFAGNEPWKNYCEFAARRLKERYFSDEAYWKDHECAESVMIHCHGNHLITIKIDQKTAHSLTEEPMERLSGRSFHEVFADSLRAVHAKITGEEPELIFLTGGVSRMEEVRTWCETEFPGAVVIVGSSPEFSSAGWVKISLNLHLGERYMKAFINISSVFSPFPGWIRDRSVTALSFPVTPKTIFRSCTAAL